MVMMGVVNGSTTSGISPPRGDNITAPNVIIPAKAPKIVDLATILI